MDEQRLEKLLNRGARARILVIGDFFLDRYLVIDPARVERSVETGLAAHQVVDVRAAPGAAGTVSANLRALGATVTVLGIIGDDGEGYELRRGLRASGVDERAMVVAGDRRTPTYTKPIVRDDGAVPYELERLDIRTRTPVPEHTIDALIDRLRALAVQAHAVIIADQMPEPECGVITTRVRAMLAQLAAAHPDIWFLADSRERIGLFEQVIVKPNARECVRAVYPDDSADPPLALVAQAAEQLRQRTGKPVFITLGARGILVIHERGIEQAPAPPVFGPIDVTGAGDSVMAALAVALCAGASPEEAATLGNLAAAVTIRQLGTTGVATPAQVLEQWRAWHAEG